MKNLVKINWAVRFKNKAFVLTFAALTIAFVYQVLGMFDVVPSISEESVVNIVTILVNILATFGLFVDPTTPGVSDSDRAMTYGTDADVRNTEG